MPLRQAVEWRAIGANPLDAHVLVAKGKGTLFQLSFGRAVAVAAFAMLLPFCSTMSRYLACLGLPKPVRKRAGICRASQSSLWRKYLFRTVAHNASR